MRLEISGEANWALNRLVDRSRRRTGARLPSAFARGDGDGSVAPLASLLKGGRGGSVRLKLYLSTVLLAGGEHVHAKHGRNTIVDVSGPTWAHALALPDAPSGGARRVADAQRRLAELNLIALERRPGNAPKVTLLHAAATGEKWVEPGTPYILVPLELWTNRWIWYLNAKELAVYIAILDLCGGKGLDKTGGPQVLSGTHLRYYDMSADTWRIASASLERLGLVETDREVARLDLESPRLRKRYQVAPSGLEQMAPVDPFVL